jgi:V/A-type H+-transporting ATPase subunit E
LSTDRILQKIRQEADGEAAAVISAAREKADASAKKIFDRAKGTADLTEKGAVTTAEEVTRRTMQAAGLEARKNSLMSRRAVIDEAFELAWKRLLSLPEDRYEALISALVVESAETGNESISVNAADLGRYKNGLIQKLNAALEKAGKREG